MCQYESLENLWEALLSRQGGQILAAFNNLSVDERQTVLAHLQRMAVEPGWHQEQQKSAQKALEAIQPGRMGS